MIQTKIILKVVSSCGCKIKRKKCSSNGSLYQPGQAEEDSNSTSSVTEEPQNTNLPEIEFEQPQAEKEENKPSTVK